MGDESIHMKPASPEQAVFAEALQCATPEARAAYLASTCGTDTALRRRVEALLRAAENAGDFLEQPPVGLAGDADSTSFACGLSEKSGDRIGRYKLLEQIGEGGCGVVYMAEQEEPVRRRVALKVIKLGMDTKSVIARFEAERQALALMDHPNIAKVFDGGATQTGRPYFVMELVRGLRITEFCDEARLPTDARLRLFVQVCQAVQHAHQKGIIHRDLKPSNILVTVNDGAPVPKVIDFGIAKATGQKLTDKTLFTHFHAFIGTPAYTSPEQAEMSSVDVDTRSDIYSLGVLLYELLTGCTPFDGEELLRSGLDEMRRIIRDVEPPKPSTRLSSHALAEERKVTLASHGRNEGKAQGGCGASSPSVRVSLGPSLPQKHRRLQDHKVRAHRIRGDLDWIVMKCLEKDRSRRYGTANDLAADIQRHLAHEPIQARPVSVLGRFWRWRRRHPGIAILSASVLLLLIVVAVGSAVAAWRVTTARRAEHAERQKADAANRDLRSANSRLADTVNVLELRRAEDLLRINDSSAGVAHLVAMLRGDPSNHVVASRLVSALVHRNWALPALPPILHRDRVSTVAFSPDGKQILSASWDKTAQVFDAASGTLRFVVHHDDAVLMAQYDGVGRRIVTTSADGTARIWNAGNGEPLTPPMRHKGKVLRAEFSPDGQSLLTTAAEKLVRLWNATNGALRFELRAHSIDTTAARFAPDGARLVTASAWGSIRIWPVASTNVLSQVDAHYRAIHSLAFNRDDRPFASAGEDGKALLWDLSTGQRVGAAMDHEGPVRHAVFSPDGRWLLTAAHGGAASLWNATNGQPVGPPMQHDGSVVFGAFSSDGRAIVTTSMDNSARLWSVRNGTPLCQPLRSLEAVSQARFSPDGLKLVTGSWDRTVQIWNIWPTRYQGTELRVGKGVILVAFDPLGTSVACASIDRMVRQWDARTGQAIGQPMPHERRVQSIDYSPDGRRIVTACADGAAYLWDTATGLRVGAPLQHSNTVWLAQFSPDGERVATASEDGTARVWNAATSQPLTPPLDHGAPVNAARFSPDGRWLATASDNWSAQVWDASTGRPVTERLPHRDNVEWVEFSPNGQSLVSASSDNTARVWQIGTSQPIGPPLQHTRTVQKAIFSPDGRRVVTASLDGTARIWDAITGEAQTSPLQHPKAVTQVAFSPDGQRLLTTGWDPTWRLWDAATGHPLTEWLEGGGPGQGAVFDPAGQRVVAATFSGSIRVWDTPRISTPVPASFLALSDGIAGMRLSARGDVEIVSRGELDEAAKGTARVEKDGFYESLARWMLADPTLRTTSPY